MRNEHERPTTIHPEGLRVIPEAIPAILTQRPQWVCWRYVETGKAKPDKQPVNPHTLHNAGIDWPNTWSPFKLAFARYQQLATTGQLNGIGFVLTIHDPIVGIDLDHCIVEQGITNEAQQILDTVQSYAEISPSGHGLRILVICPTFAENRRTHQVELYSHKRWLTITGHHIATTPNTLAAVEPSQLHALLPAPSQAPSPPSTLPERRFPVEDDVLWQRIFAKDRFGTAHHQRFQGNLTLDGDDHSLTVIRLLNCLARWTQGDAIRMRRMMLQSALVNPKWAEKRGGQDWLDYQINDAIAFVQGRKRG